MSNSPLPDLDSRVLSEPAAERLLAHASELDKRHGAGVTVADLRAAASEAGIATTAFDEALAELDEDQHSPTPAPRARAKSRSRVVIFTIALHVAVVAVAVMATRPSGQGQVARVPLLEETLVLECLAPAEAAEMILPLLRFKENQMQINPTRAPRVVNLRVTAEQLVQVKALLAPYEAADSRTCQTRPAK